jgi:hypothetical protein
MEVKLSRRVVFHKYVEVYVTIPDEVSEEDVADYINDDYEYENLLTNELDNINAQYGLGLDEYMNDIESTDESRFDVVGKNYGGHL